MAGLFAATMQAQGPLAPAPPPRSAQEAVPAPAGISVNPASLTGGLGGSIPTGQLSAEPIALTLTDAVARALKYNLAIAETGESVQLRRAERLRALSLLLPTVSARPSVSEQQVNLAAFGFSGFPGIPSVVGPFSIYDARASLSQSVFNFQNLRNLRAAKESVRAAELTVRDIRDQVVLVVANLYLQATAISARIDTARAQVATADAAYQQAVSRRNAGTSPGIDVLRAQVQLQSEQQRLFFYEGEFEKQKLDLARAIGLPLGQQFTLTDVIPYAPLPQQITVETALEEAYRQRSDYKAAEAQVRTAELAKSAAQAARLPSAGFDANYGVIGPSLDNMHGSFTVGAGVDIPIFQGGRIRAAVESADAVLNQRRAELEDLRGRIDADVRRAFVDVRSSARQVEVAIQNVDLAKQQQQQAQDRFAAGVTNTLEVVQAQQALAMANEGYISSLYAFNAAKAALLRARGNAEQSLQEIVGRK